MNQSASNIKERGHEACPRCGHPKHPLMACSACGYSWYQDKFLRKERGAAKTKSAAKPSIRKRSTTIEPTINTLQPKEKTTKKVSPPATILVQTLRSVEISPKRTSEPADRKLKKKPTHSKLSTCPTCGVIVVKSNINNHLKKCNAAAGTTKKKKKNKRKSHSSLKRKKAATSNLISSIYGSGGGGWPMSGGLPSLGKKR